MKNIEHVLLELGTTCNLKCPDCLHVLDPKKPTNITISEIIKILKRYPRLKEVILSGNYSEPTLYPDFIKLVKLLQIMKLNISIYTNLESKNIQFWTELNKILKPSSQLVLSLFGTKGYHEKYRIGGNFDKWLEHYNILTCNIQLQFIQFDYNKQELDKLQVMFKNKDIIVIPNNNINEFFYNDFQNISYPVDIECNSLKTNSIEINERSIAFPCHLARNYNKVLPIKDGSYDYTEFISGKYNFCKMFCNKNKPNKIKPW